MWVTTDKGKKHKVQDLICWNFLEGRRCVKHAELSEAYNLQAVIVPIPSKHSSKSKQQQTPAVPANTTTVTQPHLCCSHVTEYAEQVHKQISCSFPCHLDSDLAIKPGAKCYKWERLGIPLRLEIGQHEAHTGTVTIILNPGLMSAVKAALIANASSSSSSSSSRLLLQYVGGCPITAALTSVAATPAQAAVQQQTKQPPGSESTPTAGEDVTFATAESSAPAAAAAAAAGAPAVSTRQGNMLRLSQVPLIDCASVCCALLEAAAVGLGLSQISQPQQQQQQQQQHMSMPHSSGCCCSSSSWPRLLSNGFCNKLHLWPNNSSSSSMPCTAHIRHLLCARKPCFCGAAPHIHLEDLHSEITDQLAAADGADVPVQFSQIATAGSHCMGDTPQMNSSSTTATTTQDAVKGDSTVGIFMTGIPKSLPAAAVRQQLQQQFQRVQGYCNAVVPAVGRRNRGWSRVLMRSVEEAEQAMGELEGQLVISPNNNPLQMSWCCGRADALFSDLPYDTRRQLRIDSVAAYSMTDSSTAAAMAALLAAVAAVVKGWHQETAAVESQESAQAPQDALNAAATAAAACGIEASEPRCHDSGGSSSSSSSSVLSVTDLTACAGGNVIAFMKHFSCVTAVEVDPDRAEDLLHNIQVVMQPLLLQQQQQQQQQHQHQQQQHGPCTNSSTLDCKSMQPSEASTAMGNNAANGVAFNTEAVPQLAVLHCRQQQQLCSCVAVLCCDAVELASKLQQQDVVFLDPPWGGPNYQQQQQQQQQQQRTSHAQHSSSSSRVVSTERLTSAAQGNLQLCSANDYSSSLNGGTSVSTDNSGLCLSGIPLPDLCCDLFKKCYVLAVKLPSRWSGLDKFCKTVQQRQQECDSDEPQAYVGCLCIRARYGRSELVMFVRAAGTEQQDRLQDMWIKQLRECLKQHQQHSASIS